MNWQPDVALGRALDRVSRNPVRWAIGTAFAAIVFGGTTFSLVEPSASMPDGWWWAFVSMSTVGYGDLAPKTVEVRFIATFVIATGVASTAILTAALAGRIAERRLAPANLTPELDDDFDDLIDRIKVLKSLTSDPRVKTALVEVHHDREGTP